MAKPRVRTGRPYPLGATWDGKGVNFALHSAAADEVLLCLFDVGGGNERRLPLTHRQHHVWYGYVPDLAPGTLYAYRVKGAYDPGGGRRCNPHKLLLDPYARAIAGEPAWSSAHYSYVPGEEAEDFSCSVEDDAAGMPKCVVIDNAFDWQGTARPRTPWPRTVIYEVHVKGFTQAHPDVPEALRGSYAGFASPPAIAHFRRLGITAVELLPVHAFVDDQRLAELGLVNYWGYNSIGFFAPEARYATDRTPGGAVREFKQMVKTLHEAGIEVILDVVYNHTAEGNHLGPTLSFKGIDHAAYYRLSPEDRRYNVDYTGCGNTLNTTSPVVLRLIMDSLRYWVAEMGVDGFRFDLASALGRGAVDFDPHAAFFAAIAQDPLLSTVKLIAEPWDLGPGGYRVGGYPHGWAEWNGAYRDTVRSFWCQREGHLTQLAQRLCGSADIYEPGGRLPTDSINLVTVHDGFTLADLTAYNHKHNEANGEDNRDGENHNRGWNGGFEGPTDDELVQAQRARMRRNLLATLLLSQGTPLLLGGDEFGRTQRGNNNGYCQDNELSWFDWRWTADGERLLAFTERLLALRRDLPALRRPRFFTGRPGPDGEKDITWRLPDGSEMPPERWHDPGLTAVAAHLSRWAAVDDEAEGDDTAAADAPAVLLLINGGDEPAHFQLPSAEGEGASWRARVDTCTASGFPVRGDAPVTGGCTASGRSIVLLTQDAGEEA
jgi:isoamylase